MGSTDVSRAKLYRAVALYHECMEVMGWPELLGGPSKLEGKPVAPKVTGFDFELRAMKDLSSGNDVRFRGC